MKIIWTKHAEERQAEWEKRLKITRQEMEDLINNPPQIVPDDLDVLVAQKLRDNGLLRVPFVELNEQRKILTVYWTSKIKKYWRGKDENKI